MTEEELVARALDARTRAYAPYSRFAVGAALEAASGRVYTGCNVENAAYPVGLCAERAALAAAVSAAFPASPSAAAGRGSPPASPAPPAACADRPSPSSAPEILRSCCPSRARKPAV